MQGDQQYLCVNHDGLPLRGSFARIVEDPGQLKFRFTPNDRLVIVLPADADELSYLGTIKASYSGPRSLVRVATYVSMPPIPPGRGEKK